jgi:hypothetical protein
MICHPNRVQYASKRKHREQKSTSQVDAGHSQVPVTERCIVAIHCTSLGSNSAEGTKIKLLPFPIAATACLHRTDALNYHLFRKIPSSNKFGSQWANVEHKTMDCGVKYLVIRLCHRLYPFTDAPPSEWLQCKFHLSGSASATAVETPLFTRFEKRPPHPHYS